MVALRMVLSLRKKIEPKIKTKLFAKSIFTSILKVLAKFIEKCRRSRDLVIDTWPKWHFEIWPFLWFLANFSRCNAYFLILTFNWVCPLI